MANALENTLQTSKVACEEWSWKQVVVTVTWFLLWVISWATEAQLSFQTELAHTREEF